MIVTDGDQRFEVRITSDTEKNGTIAFVHNNLFRKYCFHKYERKIKEE